MMRMDKQHSPGSSTGRSFCLPFLFLSLALTTAAILIIIFVLKPKKPSFHLHAVQLGSSDAASSEAVVNDSSAIVSLLLVAQNPNRLGIRYTSSELGLVYGSNNMGLIKVPTFFQPARSKNVTVLVHVFLQTIDINDLVSEESMQSSSTGNLDIRIFGGIQAWAHVLNFRLPKIKVFLDCRIRAKLSAITLSRVLSTSTTHKAVLLPNIPLLSQKCSLALCI